MRRINRRLLAALLLCCLTFTPSALAEGQESLTSDEIEAADAYSAWTARYPAMQDIHTWYNQDHTIAGAWVSVLTSGGEDVLGSAFASSMSGNSYYFSGGTLYEKKKDASDIVIYLGSLAQEEEESYKYGGLIFSANEKITSVTETNDGRWKIVSETPASEYNVPVAAGIDLTSFDLIQYTAVVEKETLLPRSLAALGVKDGESTLLSVRVYDFLETPPPAPAFAADMRDAEETRRVTVWMNSEDEQTYTLPKGVKVDFQCPEGYGVYAGADYAETDDADPDSLNADQTLYYLPVKTAGQ